jgi:hypothetical protein
MPDSLDLLAIGMLHHRHCSRASRPGHRHVGGSNRPVDPAFEHIEDAANDVRRRPLGAFDDAAGVFSANAEELVVQVQVARTSGRARDIGFGSPDLHTVDAVLTSAAMHGRASAAWTTCPARFAAGPVNRVPSLAR